MVRQIFFIRHGIIQAEETANLLKKSSGDVFRRTKYVLETIINNYRGTIAVVAHEANLREAGTLLLGDPDIMNYGLCAVNCLKKIEDR